MYSYLYDFINHTKQAFTKHLLSVDFPVVQKVKNLPANAGDVGSIPGLGRPLEKGMAIYSNILAWRIPWTEEPWWATVHEVTKHRTWLGLRLSLSLSKCSRLWWGYEDEPNVLLLSVSENEKENRYKNMTLWDPMDCSSAGSSNHGFPRQEYWSGLPFPSLGDVPDPGIEPRSPVLQRDS